MTEPPAVHWDGSLENLFAILDEACRRGTPPRRLDRPGPPDRAAFPAGADNGGGRPLQPELFAGPDASAARTAGPEEGSGGPPGPGPEGSPAGFPELRRSPAAALLRELSADAFDAVVHAWMSGLPGAEIVRYAWGVIAAAREQAFRGRPPGAEPPEAPGPPAAYAGTPGAGPGGPDAAARIPGWAALPEARRGAEQAAAGRGSPETRAVLEAAYKAGREIDRLRGLLRFRPCSSGSGGPVYVARCSPDHYVLPGLAEHFTQRFGQCPWAVIDEKRGLVLAGEPGRGTRLFPLVPDNSRDGGNPGDDGHPGDHGSSKDCYEVLWRNYHRSINNPDRNNPALQRQFMPRRYWKYLTEFQ